MRFFTTVLSGLALASSVFAQSSAATGGLTATPPTASDTPTGPSTGALAINEFPSTGARAGQPTTITFTAPNSAPVTITLRKGDPNDLETIEVLTTSATGGSYTWTPATDLAAGSDYALEIRQGGGAPNYSAQFGITGGTGTRPSSSEASSATLSTSVTAAPSSSSNGTQTRSPSPTGSTSRSASASAPANTNVPGAGALSKASPIALLFGVVGAMLFFH